MKSLDEIRQRLVDRNLFVAYAPKSTGEATADASASEAEFSGTVYGSDGWQGWVRNKTSGQVSRFAEGDAIEFGTFKGKVVEIENRRMVIETDKGRVELREGQNFSQTTLLAPPAA